MEFPKLDIVETINRLLPGFLALSIFHAFTAHPHKTAFERVIQALIATGVLRFLTIILHASLE